MADDPDERDFITRFPRIPTPLIAKRDFNGFTVAQRALVQSLLLARRFALAAVATLNGQRALLVHAGLRTSAKTLAARVWPPVLLFLILHLSLRENAIEGRMRKSLRDLFTNLLSTRELEVLGIPHERDPERIARALNTWLDDRVERVAGAWRAGEHVTLDLEPLHFGGGRWRRGQRLPLSPPDQRHAERLTSLRRAQSPPRPPPDCRSHGAQEIAGRARRLCERARARRRVRRRHSHVTRRRHAALRPRSHPGAATVVMIDAGMGDPRVEEYPLLELTDVVVAR